VKNFAPIGRRSSEITQGKKRKKEMPANLKSAPQAVASGRTNNAI